MPARELPRRFWVESILSVITLGTALLTALWHDWIELVFKVDPDRGSGLLEWSIVGVLAVTAVVLALLARAEWRRVVNAEA